MRALCGAWLLAALVACGDGAEHPPPVVLRDSAAEDAGGGQDGLRDAAAGFDAGSGDAGGSGEDAGGPQRCAPGACDLRDPDACGAGEGCRFDLASAAARCAPVGQGADGAGCTSGDDCAAGYDCTARGDAGVCRRYCCASADACPAGQYCGVGLQDQSGASTGVYLCAGCELCDLLDRDGCGAGLGCYLLPAQAACRACLAAGDAALGQRCEFSTDCQPAAACVRARSGDTRCTAYCALGATTACHDGLSCRALAGAQLPAGVGLCL